MKLARSLPRTRSLAPHLVGETLPGPAVRGDDEWLDFARRRGSTADHLVGTCRMGPGGDPAAAVDPGSRVHGLEGLRVVDASVMPQMPSANTQAAALMVAQRAGDMIRGRPVPPRDEPAADPGAAPGRRAVA